MKKFLIFVFSSCLFFLAGNLSALELRRDNFQKPQVGAWFGPVTPVGKTARALDAYLGGGAYIRYNFPWKYLKVGADASWQYMRDEVGDNRMYLAPFYGNLLLTLPINIPPKFQVKAGAGGAWIHIQPRDRSRWDPLFVVGGEMSFPAGRFVNIGLRVDYLHLYEQHLENSVVDGHVVNTGITISFNLNI